MATFTAEVTGYEVLLGRQLEIGGGKFFAAIVCSATDGTKLYIYFSRPDSISLPNSYNPQYKNGNAFLPYDLYPTYIDLLRNEKPIRMYLNSDKPQWNQLMTGEEPVGEEE